MVVTILAILLGLIMTVGGVIPNVANGMLQNKIDQALNHPEYLRVKVHPEAPSYSLLGGNIAYTEVDAQRFVISDFPVEELQLRVDRLSADTSGDKIVLRESSQGMVRVKITETGINRFIASDTFRQLLDEGRKKQALAAQFDADITDLNVDLQADRILIRGQAATMGGFFTIPFELSGRLRLTTERTLNVVDVQATTLDRPLPDDTIQAILTALNPVLDLSKFSNDDMQLYFRQLSVNNDQLELVGEAKLKKLPG